MGSSLIEMSFDKEARTLTERIRKFCKYFEKKKRYFLSRFEPKRDAFEPSVSIWGNKEGSLKWN